MERVDDWEGEGLHKDEDQKEEGCILKRIQEIRDRGTRFQQRKKETRQLLLETAEAMDKVKIEVIQILSSECRVTSRPLH